MRRLLVLLLASLSAAFAASRPVYVVLWFDTEDYIEPASDDAALRIATDLDSVGVRATFKMVGEKARVLEARGRRDVLNALARQDIGYHTDFHSIPPTPSVYLRELGFLEGADEFYRREAQGAADLRRIFGVAPSCYGQPGSSWGPQSYPALRRMGIQVYLDEGEQVGLNDQPFWYGGLLHVYHMGRYVIQPSLNDESRLPETLARFDKAVEKLAGQGGLISTYYHPTEFVTAEFWDSVNFAKGANPERSEWKKPRRRTPEDSEMRYRILKRYAEYARSRPGVRFVTARDLPLLYESSAPPRIPRDQIARHLSERITFLETGLGTLSAADLLLQLLGMEPEYVDGPVARRDTTVSAATIPRPAFERATRDAVAFIRAHKRLPAAVWVGVQMLSIADFAATLAGGDSTSPAVTVRKGNLEFEKFFSTDPAGSFQWPIHPAGFRAPELLELGRLQGWTLKPARVR